MSKQPHKHAELIKAWADGAVIQFLGRNSWYDCKYNCPSWDVTTEYRIKPDPKPDVVRYASVGINSSSDFTAEKTQWDNLKLIFDGETGALKNAEVIK